MQSWIWFFLLVAPRCAERRIYGGYKAELGVFKYHAAVGYKTWFSNDVDIICGGSIIHPKFVLTAAHCLESDRKMAVMVDSIVLSLNEGRWYDVDYMIVRDEWNNGSFSWDITLLVLKESIEIIPGRVEIVNIPEPDSPEISIGETGWICGWGLTKNHDDSRYLRKIELAIISEDACAETWSPEHTERICCQSSHSGWGTCGGDSGGGLVHGSTLIGILSYGTKDCALGRPEVYTKIKQYTTWIRAMISKYSRRRMLKHRYSLEYPEYVLNLV